jgi:hypothetical protein
MKHEAQVLDRPVQTPGNAAELDASQAFTPDFTETGINPKSQEAGGNMLANPAEPSVSEQAIQQEPKTADNNFGPETKDGTVERRIAVVRATDTQRERLEAKYGKEKAAMLTHLALGAIEGDGDTATKVARAIGYEVDDDIPQETRDKFARDALTFASEFGDEEEKATAIYVLTGKKPNRPVKPLRTRQEIVAEIDKDLGPRREPYKLEEAPVPESTVLLKPEARTGRSLSSRLGELVTRSFKLGRGEQTEQVSLSSDEQQAILSALDTRVQQGDPVAIAAARRVRTIPVRRPVGAAR